VTWIFREVRLARCKRSVIPFQGQTVEHGSAPFRQDCALHRAIALTRCEA